MTDLNSCTFTGRIGTELTLKVTPEGKPYCGFRFAVGGFRDETDWFDAVAFGRAAEALASLAAKGTKIAVAGRVRNEEWEAKDGTKRHNAKLIIREWHFCESKKAAAEDGAEGGE
jgi:single-strand DNA-binding protein